MFLLPTIVTIRRNFHRTCWCLRDHCTRVSG